MRLSGVGVAAVLALALMNSADATPVPPGAVALKAAADNPVTQVQWVGWGNGSQARLYRWHKRPVFNQGRRPCYGPPYGYSNWGYYNYGPCGAPHTTVPWWFDVTK
jgi:hypothetical protein